MRRLVRMLKNEDGSDASSAPIVARKRVEQVVKSKDGGVQIEASEVLSDQNKVTSVRPVVNNSHAGVSNVAVPDLTSTGLVGWWTFEDGGVVSTAVECTKGKGRKDRKDDRKCTVDGSRHGVKLSQPDKTMQSTGHSPSSSHHVKYVENNVEGCVPEGKVDHLDVKGAVLIDRMEARTRQERTSASSHSPVITDDDQDLIAAERKIAGDMKKRRVTDVAEHRFPSLIRRHVSPLAFRPPSLDPTLFQLTPPHPIDKPPDTSTKSDMAVSERERKKECDKEIEGGRNFLRNILTINASAAVEKWNRMGGIGLQWQWLDAEYLSSLSHLTALSISSNTGVPSPSKEKSEKKIQPGTTTNILRLPLSALPKVPVPVPSYCEDNQCPFELRKCKLAQLGRDLQIEVPCPQGEEQCYTP